MEIVLYGHFSCQRSEARLAIFLEMRREVVLALSSTIFAAEAFGFGASFFGGIVGTLIRTAIGKSDL